MPIVFDRSYVHDRQRSMTVERAFQMYGSWSGIHDYDFRDSLSEPTVTLNATGGWDAQQLLGEVPTDVEMTYSVEGKGHGILLRYIDSTHYLRLGLTEDDFIEVWEANGGAAVLKRRQPVALPESGNVRVSFRDQRYSSDEADIWQSISIWMNDQLLLTWTFYTGAVIEGTLQVGVIAEASTRVFTNIRIPQLTEYAEWSSIDPGETPSGGLQRAIEGRYCKYYIRYDGTLRAWRASVAPSVKAYTASTAYQLSRTTDRRAMATHVRMLGAYVQADFIRTDLVRELGYRFYEASNPYIMTTEACYREAEREMLRMEEKYITESLRTEFCPLLEPEDHITTPQGERIAQKVDWGQEPGSRITQTLNCRSYIYGA